MTTPRYAARTGIPADQTRTDIERMLKRHGARQFAYGTDDDRGLAVVQFAVNNRQIRLMIPVPDPGSTEFTRTPARGLPRSQAEAERVYDQAVRQRWRALFLIIKAKLEAVAAGVLTFEDEFLPYTVLPGGRTVAETVYPAIEKAYQSGEVPALLPGLPTSSQ